MYNGLTIRPAVAAADFDRLRSYIYDKFGSTEVRLLDEHLQRPRYLPDFTRIVEQDGQIVGYVLIAHTRLRLGGTVVEAGTLQRVMMQDAGQAERLHSVLGDCMRVLLENGIPLALVHASLPAYAEFGFAQYRYTYLVKGWQAPERAPVLRAIHEYDLEDVSALYDVTYRYTPLSAVRSAPDWRTWLSEHPSAVVMEDGRGRCVAYAVHNQQDTSSVIEAAAADAGVARTLLAALAAREPSLQLSLGPQHPISLAALQLGATARITTSTSGDGDLAGVVDLPGILEALRPAFDTRLARSRYADWSGNIRIEIDTERVTLACVNGRTEVIDGSRPADVRLRRVTLPALVQTCLGYRGVADLRATGELDCDDSTLGLLDTLFPVVMPL